MVRSLYGTKSSGDAFQNHLADCIHNLVLLPCPVDLYLCMKTMMRPEDGFDYYAYVLIYVDYVMVIHNDAESVLRRIDNYFKLKPTLIGDPDIYLGAKLKNMRI